jgi:hypothetical protein
MSPNGERQKVPECGKHRDILNSIFGEGDSMLTRWTFGRVTFLASGLFLAGLGMLSAPASAEAAPRREPQKISNQQLREGYRVLQVTKKMLEGADHDYGGHRVAAIKAISAAEHQLKLALHSQHKKGGKAAPKAVNPDKGNKRPEPQGISNLQLADAIVILQKTEAFLKQANHDYGGHRAQAVKDLGVAVKQLKVALKYEKKREK